MVTDVISINLDVYEQKVMLSEVVEQPELKVQAEELARAVKGIKTIYNEILIIKTANEKEGATETFGAPSQ